MKCNSPESGTKCQTEEKFSSMLGRCFKAVWVLFGEVKRPRAFLVPVTSLRRARAANATANVRPPTAAAGTMAAGRVNATHRCCGEFKSRRFVTRYQQLGFCDVDVNASVT